MVIFLFCFEGTSRDLSVLMFWLSVLILLVFSRDGSEKPFEIKLYFFLDEKSDQRKLLFGLGKTNFMKKLATYSAISFH